ncbi:MULTISPECIES: SigE family RNA polymerase sigma factor [unclassified Streptomyces]|uniref:SigE family RNA polymerase sigma factor n=1 Tax=Streptomyces sp. NPDC006678 TaxID=3157185 RepID=UPI0033E52919
MRSDIDEDFRDFMASRWPRLLRTAHLLTGNHHDAEELVQGTLARAYVKWDHVQRSDDMDAYIRQILIHSHADRFRRRRVREWFTPRLPDTAVADRTSQVEQRDALVDALARLPARQRAAVVLRYFEDLTDTQTAAALGTRAATVRSQVTRGLAKLRQDPSLAALAGPTADTDDPSGLPTAEEGALR